jgi:signal peptidase I
MLADGMTVELVAQGSSMRPLFPPGAIVRVAPATLGDVRLGDVVLVADGEQLIAHRLVRVDRRGIVTRGDSMPCDDEPLPAAALIGRVDVPPTPLAVYAAVRALLRC